MAILNERRGHRIAATTGRQAEPPISKFQCPLLLERRILPYSIEVLANYVTRMVPGSLLVLRVVDESACSLNVAQAWGIDSSSIARLEIPLGKRLSGRVAVTMEPVFDADPTLDFSGENNIDSKRFISCTATPVIADGRIQGVLTLYLPSTFHFTDLVEGNLSLTSAHMSTHLTSFRRST